MAERAQHQRWAESQIAALVAVGVDPIDAQRSVDWVLAHLPAGANPATWVPTAADLEVSDVADIADARVAWYANDAIPAAFKRLLDAAAEDD